MPFDSSSPRKTVKTGSRVHVELLRKPTSARRIIDAARLHGRQHPEPMHEPARFTFHDIGTFYAVTSGNQSSYRETVSEMPVGWSDTDKATLRNRYLANVTTTNVGGSNRHIEACERLQSDSDETDGLITTLVLKNESASKRYNLIAATDTWTEAVPPALRLAALATLPAGPSSQTIAGVRAGILGESLESWDAFSRHRTGTDGTMMARMLDGRWRVAVESVRQFYSFDTSDFVNYKITDEPAFERPEAPTMSCEFGQRQSTSVDVWLVPQQTQYRLDWIARYLLISIFGEFQTVEYASTTAYQARLPFYPYRYSMNLIGTATNANAMSEGIKRTEAYAALIAEDAARAYVGPFGGLFLDGRVNGQWRIYQREVAVGQLVGVLRYRYQNGPPILRYVWRRTLDPRPLTELDSGALNVPGEVSGII